MAGKKPYAGGPANLLRPGTKRKSYSPTNFLKEKKVAK